MSDSVLDDPREAVFDKTGECSEYLGDGACEDSGQFVFVELGESTGRVWDVCDLSEAVLEDTGECSEDLRDNVLEDAGELSSGAGESAELERYSDDNDEAVFEDLRDCSDDFSEPDCERLGKCISELGGGDIED